MNTNSIQQGKVRQGVLPTAVRRAVEKVAACAGNLQSSVWTDVEPEDNPKLCVARDCDFLARLPTTLHLWSQIDGDHYGQAGATVRDYTQAIKEVGPSAGLDDADVAPLVDSLTELAKALG